MDLPEIRYLIAGYLEPRDLMACLQVSRTWHAYYCEWAYRFVKIRLRHPEPNRMPLLEWMQKYGRLIQELDLRSDRCSPLHYLVSAFDQQEQPMVLLPRLKRLNIRPPCTLRVANEWLSHCPNLVSLTMRDIENYPLTNSYGAPSDAKDRGLYLLQNCPRLVRLDIDNRNTDLYSGLFRKADVFEMAKHWPPLLTEFKLGYKSASRSWFEAISGPPLGRMTVLNFYECAGLKDWMFNKIVRSCPHLVEFRWRVFRVDCMLEEEEDEGLGRIAAATRSKALSRTKPSPKPSTFDEAVDRMGPWACKGLQKLDIFLMCWSECLVRNRAMMRHLGRLSELRRLFVGTMTFDDFGTKKERDRLLGDFPWPKEFCVYLSNDLKTRAEVRWMRETWPRLEAFELQSWEFFL